MSETTEAASAPPPGEEDWIGSLKTQASSALGSLSFASFASSFEENVDNMAKATADQLSTSWRSAKTSLCEAKREAESLAAPIAAEADRMVKLAESTIGDGAKVAQKLACETYAKNPEIFIAGSFAALVLGLPATRRRLVMSFRTNEGLLRSATRRQAVLSETVDLHLQETKKLLERTKVAKDEYLNTQKKLRDARNQLDSLQSRLHRTDSTMVALMDELSFLKSKDAAAVRSEVSVHKGVVEKAIKQTRGAIKEIARTAGI